MQALAEVILPVFLVLGFGYLAAWRGWFSEAGVDALMTFTQGFAFPCLLFSAIARIDLAQSFDLPLLGAFYLGAWTCFAAGLAGARYLFGRPWPDSVAIGFCAMFSNSLMLGLPITERAYGPDALEGNLAIIALHAPSLYLVGITAMEISRGQGGRPWVLLGGIARTTLRNPLVIGILSGFAVNLSGLSLPGPLVDALDLMVSAALPAALFGLGGVLYRYRPEGDLRTVLFVCALSLVLHPTVTYGLSHLFGLSVAQTRSAVITAAMAPGVNVYVFSNLYGVAKRVAASSLLLATGLTMITAWAWLHILP